MEEYVCQAINRGLKTLGFSDHTPYPFPGGYTSYAKMQISDMDFYFSTLLSLREKYGEYIEIPIGFETEYYPAYWDNLFAEYRKYPLEYLLYGAHHIGNEPDSFCAFDRTDDPARLTAYVNHSITALETGKFTAMTHPDCLNFVGSEELYRSEMRRLIAAAMRLGIPIEVNMQGMRRNAYYPNSAFWEEAAEMGAVAYIGMDCHNPAHVADPDELERVCRFVEKHKINVIDKLSLINPLI